MAGKLYRRPLNSFSERIFTFVRNNIKHLPVRMRWDRDVDKCCRISSDFLDIHCCKGIRFRQMLVSKKQQSVETVVCLILKFSDTNVIYANGNSVKPR